MEEYALSRRLFVRASACLLAGSASASRAAAATTRPQTNPEPNEADATALADDADFRCEIVRRQTAKAGPDGESFAVP